MSTDIGPQYTGQPLPPPPGGPEGQSAEGGPRGHWHSRRRRALVASSALALLLGAAVTGYALTERGGTTTASTNSSSLSVAELEARVDPTLVDIVSSLDYGTGEAAGTGIVLTPTGEVLTNNHVVEGATAIRVTDVGNNKTYAATVVGYDFTRDVAVLQLKGASGLKPATIGNSSSIAVGQGVLALGNAGGRGGTPSSATGTVTGLGQAITAYDAASGTYEQLTGLVETDADIQSGDSGGPLVNMEGQVVGMDTAASSSFQFQGAYGVAGSTQGYAIPINTAIAIARQIEAGHASASVHIGPSAFLGVELASASSFFPNGFGSNGFGPPGATIAGVLPGSPAASAGLSEGDTITSLGGHAISGAASLRSVLTHYYPGQKVAVSWVGELGTTHTATLKLASGPTE